MFNNTQKEKGIIGMAVNDLCKNPLGRVLLVPLLTAVISGLTGAVGGFFGVKMEVDTLKQTMTHQSEKITTLSEDFKSMKAQQETLHTVFRLPTKEEWDRLNADYQVTSFRIGALETTVRACAEKVNKK